MTYGYAKEKCSCGASIKVPMPPASGDNAWGNSIPVLKDWRENHFHEMPAEPEEPPFIHESGSSHERVADEYPVQDRALIGFQRNEVR